MYYHHLNNLIVWFFILPSSVELLLVNSDVLILPSTAQAGYVLLEENRPSRSSEFHRCLQQNPPLNLMIDEKYGDLILNQTIEHFPFNQQQLLCTINRNQVRTGWSKQNCPMSQQFSLHAHVELQRSIDSIIENIYSREDAKESNESESEVNLSDWCLCRNNTDGNMYGFDVVLSSQPSWNFTWQLSMHWTMLFSLPPSITSIRRSSRSIVGTGFDVHRPCRLFITTWSILRFRWRLMRRRANLHRQRRVQRSTKCWFNVPKTRRERKQPMQRLLSIKYVGRTHKNNRLLIGLIGSDKNDENVFIINPFKHLRWAIDCFSPCSRQTERKKTTNARVHHRTVRR